MSLLRVFAAVEGSATLLQIDDDSVTSDAGAPLVARAETHPLDFGGSRGYGRLREMVQWVQPRGLATVTLTPIADGMTEAPQAYATQLDVAAGAEQRIEAPFSVAGSRFAARLEVTGLTAGLSFGEADLLLVPRRSRTGVGGGR